jgi:O-antigen/teichoic acid export membrane protein
MKSNLLKKGVLLGGLRLVGGGLALVFSSMLAKLLGPEGVGSYAYVLMCLGLLSVPIQNGWATLMLKQAAVASHNSSWPMLKGLTQVGRAASALLSLIFLVLTSLLLNFYVENVPSFLSYTSIALLSLILFADQISALRLAVLRGLNFPLWGQLPEALIKPALLIVFFAVLAKLQSQVSIASIFYAMCMASVVSACAGVFVLSRMAPSELSRARPEYALRSWVVGASFLSGSAGLIVFNSYIDILMLGHLSSLQQVGIYKVAAQIALFSGFVYTALNMLASQRFAHFTAKNDRSSIQSTAVFMARMSFVGALPLPLLFYFWGDQLIAMLFSDSFKDSLLPLFILFLSQILNVSFGMARTLLVMSGMESYVIRITLLSLVFNIVLSFFLIPLYGSSGAAFSVCVSAGFWNFMTWFCAMRYLRVDTSILGIKLDPLAPAY